jgi:hypothetical protein
MILRAGAQEGAAGDPSGVPCGSARSPVDARGGELEGTQGSGVVGEQVAAQLDRVAPGDGGEFVQRALPGELGVRVAYRAPHHDRSTSKGHRVRSGLGVRARVQPFAADLRRPMFISDGIPAVPPPSEA